MSYNWNSKNRFHNNDCPSEEFIQDYLRGDLDQDVEKQLSQHLEFCPNCENEAFRFEESEAFKLGFGDFDLGSLPVPSVAPALDNTTLYSHFRKQQLSENLMDDDSFLKTFQLSNYEILRVIGRGGMGLVFEAEQLSTRRRVAVKIIDPACQRFFSRERLIRSRQRFRAEITAAARIDHDNVVRIYEGGEESNCQFLAMQLVDGSTLSQMVDEGLDVRSGAEYIRQAALGVAAAHDIGIVHRDIKPHNILVTKKLKRAQVSDFGLAKFTDRDRESSPELTEAKSVFGTLDYISPEQLDDSSTVSAAADVYSLGAALYFCLVGRAPFRCENTHQQIRQIMERDPVEPIKLVPGLHSDLNAICMKCLEKKPANRYPSARALAADIDRYFNRIPTHAKPAGPGSRLLKLCLRNPTVSSLAGAVIALVMVGIFAGVFSYQKTLKLNQGLVESNNRLAVANTEISETNRKLGDAFTKEIELRKKTENAVAIAQHAIKKFFMDVAESPEFLRDKDGMQAIRAKLLYLAKEQLGELAKVQNTPEIEYNSTELLAKVGSLQLELAEFKNAEKILQTAEDVCDQWKQSKPNEIHLLASPEKRAKHVNDFETLDAKIASAQGSLMIKLDRHVEAEAKFRQAFDAITMRLQNDPQLTTQAEQLSIGSLFAFTLDRLNKKSEAKAIIEYLDEVAEDLWDKFEKEQIPDSIAENQAAAMKGCLVQFYNTSWAISENKRNRAGKLKHCIEIFENVDENLLTVQLRELKASLLSNAAICHQSFNLDTSKRYFKKAITEYKILHDSNPDVAKFSFEGAMALRNLASVYSSLRKFEKSEIAVQQAEDIVEKLIEERPGFSRFKRGMASIHLARSLCLRKQQRLSQAAESVCRSIAVHEKLLRERPDSSDNILQLASNLVLLSEMQLEQNDAVPSLVAYFRALLTFEKLENDEFLSHASRHNKLLGKILIRAFQNQLESFRSAIPSSPKN